MLLPELARHAFVVAVVQQEEIEPPAGVNVLRYQDYVSRRDEFDVTVCQIGNNLHHEFAYREAVEHPSVVVLHDIVLHHLIAEMTIARGDGDGYSKALAASHGQWGEALADARRAGFFGEIGNFLFPASAELTRHSKQVIVHNEYARRRLLENGVTAPIVVIDHPLAPINVGAADRVPAGTSLGFVASDVVLGMFGFVTEAKRPQAVFEAFAQALSVRPELRLLLVGEPAPNIDIEEIARQFDVPAEAWKTTGYVSDAEFDRYLMAVDRVINLRYPTAGESSGPLMRILALGKPVAVSDFAQFAELDDDLVVKVPLGGQEIPALVRFMSAPADEPESAERRIAWVKERGNLERIAREYREVLASERGAVTDARKATATPILPRIEMLGAIPTGIDRSRSITIRVRNAGDATLRSTDFGGLEYRMIVKVFVDDRQLVDQWAQLPRDLRPGDTAEIEISFRFVGSTCRVELVHAIEGIPVLEERPFASAEVVF